MQTSNIKVSNSQLFSDRMLLLRRKLRLGQEEFAKLLRVSRNYVSMIEQGRDPSQALKNRVHQLEAEYDHSNGLAETPIESELNPTESDFRMREEAPAFQGRALLRGRRLAKGWSAAEFAKRLGYSDTSIYLEIEEGRSNMGEKMIAKAAHLLEVPVSSLMDGADEPLSRSVPYGTFGAIPDVKMGPGMEGKTGKFVPLISMAQCGAVGAWTDEGYTGQGFLVYSPEDPKAFAVTLEGDSMRERYQPGDVALIFPSKEPRNDKPVLAKLNDENGGDIMVKIYHRVGNQVTLSSYNPAYQPRTYPRDAFAWIYPIKSVTQNV